MNDKDRELVEHVLRTAGTAGQEGFSFMVRYQLVNGLTSLLIASAFCAGSIYLIKRAFAWDTSKSDDSDIAAVGRGFAIVGACIALLISGCFIQDALTCIFAPEGAAIHSVVH